MVPPFAHRGTRTQKVTVSAINQSDQALMMTETEQPRGACHGTTRVSQRALDELLLYLKDLTLE